MNTCQNRTSLKVENISKSYDGKEIIRNIDIDVFHNEVVSLLGVSGVGKSTLFNIISGLELPDFGKVYCDEKDVTGVIGSFSYMLQKDLLIPHKTVLENISLPLIIKGEKKKIAEEKCEKPLREFSLFEVAHKYPKQLSGGMRQRVAFLRTYMYQKKIFLLDEPFSQLDYFTKQKIHKWYLDIAKKFQLTTLFITHDIEEAIYLSDRIYIMGKNPGEIIKEVKINRGRLSNSDFLLTGEFLAYKKEILGEILD